MERMDGVSSVQEENGSGFSLPAVSYVSYTAILHAPIQLIKQKKRSVPAWRSGCKTDRGIRDPSRQVGRRLDRRLDVRDET